MGTKLKVIIAIAVMAGIGIGAYVALAAVSTFNNTGSSFVSSTFNNSLPAAFGNPVRWYTFDGQNTTSNTSTDMSDSKISAVDTGGLRPIEGRIGQGLFFDGTNAQNVTYTTPLVNTTTIMFWIKPNTLSIPSAHRMVMDGSVNGSGATYMSLQTDGIGAPFISLRIGVTQRTLSSNVFSVVGQWMHVAATWDGTNIKIYTDCVLRATSADFSGTGVIAGFDGVNPGKIGRYASNGFGTSGNLDDVRIYDRALSATEIAQICMVDSYIRTSTP